MTQIDKNVKQCKKMKKNGPKTGQKMANFKKCSGSKLPQTSKQSKGHRYALPWGMK